MPITSHEQLNPRFLILMVILMLAIGQAVDIYLPSMPALVQSFNTSIELVQYSITVALFAFGISIFVYGPLSDHCGRKITALIGIGIFFLGSLVCVFSQTITVFLIGRTIQGLGIGSAGAVCPAIPKDQFSGSALIKAYSYISIAMAVTPVLAPVLGGYLQYYIGWRANFSFLAIYSFLIFVLFYFKLFETNTQIQNNKFSLKKMFINYKTILTDLKVWGAFVCLMVVFSGEIAYCTSLPFIVQHTLKLSSISNGWLMIVTAIGVIIGGLASSRLSSKLNSEQLLLIGILVVILGSVLMFIFAFMNIINLYVIVGPMTIYIIGTGMIYPNCIAKVMDLYPQIAGVIGSLLSSFQMLAAGIGIGIIANFNPFNQKSLAVLITMAGIMAITAYLYLIRRKVIPNQLIAEQQEV